MHKLTILTTLLLSTSIAAADIADDLAFDLGGYAWAAVTIEQSGNADRGLSIAGCYDVIATGRAAGFHGEVRSIRFEAMEGHVTRDNLHFLAFDKARHSICDRYAYARRLVAAAEALAEPIEVMRVIESTPPSQLPQGAVLLAAAQHCTQTLDALVAEGADPKAKIPKFKITIPEAVVTYCQPLAARAATIDKERDEFLAAQHERLVGPYKAVGIAGDKLQLLVDQVGFAFYGVGGTAMTEPAQFAKARLIFEVFRDNDVVTVRRYVFAGNKLKGMTYENYLAQPGSHAFR